MNDSLSNAFAVTDAQVDFFHTFGYLKLPGVFKAEITQLSRHFDAVFEQCTDEVLNWVHETHYNALRRILFGLPDRDPVLFGLLADSRIQTIAHRLLGDPFNYIPSEGNIFAGDTSWHTDEYNPNFQIPKNQIYLKLALYLDPMTVAHGGFRVIPGSHHEGSRFSQLLHKHLNDDLTLFDLPATDIPAVIVSSEPGDVLIFNHRIQHATCGTSQPRRMLYYGLAQPWREQDLPRARQAIRSLRKSTGRLYGAPLCQTQNPVLQRCLRQLNSLDTEIQPAD